MLIKDLKGVVTDDIERDNAEQELAIGVAIEDGEMYTAEGCTKVNATAYSGAIRGLHYYEPDGAAAGTVLVTNDGKIQT